jgi:hypothetical protein
MILGLYLMTIVSIFVKGKGGNSIPVISIVLAMLMFISTMVLNKMPIEEKYCSLETR